MGLAETPPPKLGLNLAEAFQPLFVPYRYKVYYGGRGGAKSWSVARALIAIAHTRKVRIGCFRELQTSIKDSVHQLLKDQIEAMGLLPWFDITNTSIRSKVTEAEFLFKGLRHNAQEIKSTEGIDIAWVEEAQSCTSESWSVLIPTIRKDGSEIWITYNPLEETDSTHVRFVKKTPPNSFVLKVGWEDNPWFPKELEAERLYMLKEDPEAYQHIWGGDCRTISDAVIFKGKYVVESFDTPEYGVRFFHGLDFGFSTDPTAGLRCYTTGEAPNEELWVDQEVYGHGVELDEIAQFLRGIETFDKWPVKADCARPETISYVKRQGFHIEGAEKWNGSVEDGIIHLRGFKKIHIHTRCKHLAEEARLYQFKVDKVSGDILPIVVDKHNHCWDALRYALDGYIKRRGGMNKWKRLAR